MVFIGKFGAQRPRYYHMDADFAPQRAIVHTTMVGLCATNAQMLRQMTPKVSQKNGEMGV